MKKNFKRLIGMLVVIMMLLAPMMVMAYEYDNGLVDEYGENGYEDTYNGDDENGDEYDNGDDDEDDNGDDNGDNGYDNPEPIFNDIDELDEWTIYAIEQLYILGVVTGFPDGSFGPERTLTRAQFVTMLGRALNSEEVVPEYAPEFEDVAEGAWYTDHVLWAVAEGIAQGTGNNLFSPNRYLTIEQMIIFAVRASGFELLEEYDEDEFAGVSYWAVQYVATADYHQMLEFLEIENSTRYATRAEAVEILFDLMFLLELV